MEAASGVVYLLYCMWAPQQYECRSSARQEPWRLDLHDNLFSFCSNQWV